MNLKLGRKHPTRAKLQLHRYLGPALPPPPPSADWTLAMTDDWGVMANDNLGDCTAAGMGHAVQVVSSNGDGLITPSDAEIVNMYSIIGHYNPADPNSDQGATEVDAMTFMCDRGLAGVKVDAFADVDHNNIEAVKRCIALFGGCYIGVQITQQDMDDFKANRNWMDLNLDNVLGGHALWVVEYSDTGLSVIAWCQRQNASWNWFLTKCDEAHALILFPWIQNSVSCDPDGFNRAQLEADLKQL